MAVPSYKFKYRRFFWPFYKSFQVKGHAYNPSEDKMFLYLDKNKGRVGIPKWSLCSDMLGPDWIEAEKKAAEESAKQKIEIQE